MLQPAFSEESVFEDFVATYAPTGGDVLEIGGVLSPTKYIGKFSSWTSVDPVYEPSPGCACVSEPAGRVHIKDTILSAHLPTTSFDFIFSCNAFQHITPVRESVEKVFTLLRPGGILYAHFGPIWSGPDGAHIEGFQWEERTYNFWDTQLIPHWSHLALDAPQMKRLLVQIYTEDFSEALTTHIYQSPWLNRASYQDYQQAFAQKGIKIRQFQGSVGIDYQSTYLRQELASVLCQQAEQFLEKLTRSNHAMPHVRDLLIVAEKQ